MKPTLKWIAVACGAAGAVVWLGRRRALLGSPVDSRTPSVTPHGGFDMPRAGKHPHAHQGLDLVAPPGSVVRAVGDGVIVSANPGLGGIVRKLQLDRPGVWARGAEPVEWIVYADLGVPLVEPGQRVAKGDPIAIVASAGFVHFAVKLHDGNDETFIDPKRAGFNAEGASWLA
jgi:murein DD-endopeptidase MepM/ murein hydrolase activator NlpD